MTNEQKLSKLNSLDLQSRIVQRKIIEFITMNKMHFDKELLRSLDLKNVIDLLWTSDFKMFDKDIIKEDKVLGEVFSARGDIDTAVGSDNFELNILIKLNQVGDKSADLSFSYICDNCKHLFPIYFYRCPKCRQIDTNDIETNLIRRGYEKGSFI